MKKIVYLCTLIIVTALQKPVFHNNNFNAENAHSRDSLLRFRESDHTYHFGDRCLKPVTTVVESCFEQFDADYWAPRTAARLGTSADEVKRMWEQKGEKARNLGTKMHAMIENYYLGGDNDTDETYRLFEEFTRHYSLVPYRTEWSVFDEDLGIAGTIDFLECRDGVFTIFDWKRSDKLVANNSPIVQNRFGKTALRPFTNIPDTSYWHYAMQVSIYRLILKRKYDIDVSGCYLAVFHPSNPTYYVLEMPYLESELTLLFDL